MKRWIWIVITLVIALSIGGYAFARHSQNEKLYTDAMQRGSLQISNKNYTAAETAYTNALKRKPNDEKAYTILNQTQSFMSANDLFKDREFANAKSGYQSVANTKSGSELLKNRAQSQLTLIKTIQSNNKKYDAIYNQALNETGEGKYAESNSTLDKIFSDKSIKQSYYKDVLQKAEKLRDKNNSALNGSSSSTSNDFESSNSSSDSNTTNNPNVTPNKNASLTSSEKKAAANYKGSNEYTVTPSQKEINGKEITASQIASARKQISAAGIDSNAMSDQDVRNVIKGAHNSNESIGKYVKAHY